MKSSHRFCLIKTSKFWLTYAWQVDVLLKWHRRYCSLPSSSTDRKHYHYFCGHWLRNQSLVGRLSSGDWGGAEGDLPHFVFLRSNLLTALLVSHIRHLEVTTIDDVDQDIYRSVASYVSGDEECCKWIDQIISAFPLPNCAYQFRHDLMKRGQWNALATFILVLCNQNLHSLVIRNGQLQQIQIPWIHQLSRASYTTDTDGNTRQLHFPNLRHLELAPADIGSSKMLEESDIPWTYTGFPATPISWYHQAG